MKQPDRSLITSCCIEAIRLTEAKSRLRIAKRVKDGEGPAPALKTGVRAEDKTTLAPQNEAKAKG